EFHRDAEAPGAVAQDQRARLAEVVQPGPPILGEQRGALDARADIRLAREARVDGAQVERDAERGGVAIAPSRPVAPAGGTRDAPGAVVRSPECRLHACLA